MTANAMKGVQLRGFGEVNISEEKSIDSLIYNELERKKILVEVIGHIKSLKTQKKLKKYICRVREVLGEKSQFTYMGDFEKMKHEYDFMQKLLFDRSIPATNRIGYETVSLVAQSQGLPGQKYIEYAQRAEKNAVTVFKIESRLNEDIEGMDRVEASGKLAHCITMYSSITGGLNVYRNEIGKCNELIGVIHAQKLEKYDVAEGRFDDALDFYDDNHKSTAWYNAGLLHFDQSKNDRAIKYLLNALITNETSTENKLSEQQEYIAYEKLGYMYTKDGKHLEAYEEFMKVESNVRYRGEDLDKFYMFLSLTCFVLGRERGYKKYIEKIVSPSVVNLIKNNLIKNRYRFDILSKATIKHKESNKKTSHEKIAIGIGENIGLHSLEIA